MDNTLFISYAHDDMIPINWLDRLSLYLAPLRRNNTVHVWDDRQITVGSDWQREIDTALDTAVAAILLIGPAFFASNFIMDIELPYLLEAREKRDLHIYPLIIGFCAFDGSELSKIQAFNDPNQPLELLSNVEQNKTLNKIAKIVARDLRQLRERKQSKTDAISDDLLQTVKQISQQLNVTQTTFRAQARRRNQLVQDLIKRLNITQMLQYEKFFFRYYDDMNSQEKFEFDMIRASTDGLYDANKEIVRILHDSPQLFEVIDGLEALQQHLVFWLNKYERVFINQPKMCLLYTGVEDGVPFPKHIEQRVTNWIAEHNI